MTRKGEKQTPRLKPLARTSADPPPESYPVPVMPTKQPWFRVPPEYQTAFRPDAWRGFTQPPDSYLTTQQLSDELGEWSSVWTRKTQQFPWYNKVQKWCRLHWFGELPVTRRGRNNGYRIPPDYRYVARLWHLCEEPRIRKAGLEALLDSPKPWLLVVATIGSTHYTQAEVARRAEQVLHRVEDSRLPLSIHYVGPMMPDERNS